MSRLTSCAVFVFCLACSAAVEEVREEGNATTPAPEEVARRELTDNGYVIRYKDQIYRYPLREVPVVVRSRPSERDPTETNAIETDEEDKRRPLFYFTTYEPAENSPPGRLPSSRPYVEIRRKRDADSLEVPESSKVGKLRRKRTYCGRCGHGGYKTYKVAYIPVTYAVYPVYYGGGGGGKGCYTCGGGYGGGGGGGSFSFSSSSSHSSSGSFGWGK